MGGILMGFMGGLLGSFTILRQLAFFSDSLGHSALLGLSISLGLGLNPSVTLLPFAALFALGFTYILERTRLWTDALLNMIYSSSLAIAIIILSQIGQYKSGMNNLLFGDILAMSNLDLVFSAVLLGICVVWMGVTLPTQMMITLNEPMAIARGISVSTHRTAFIVLLSLVVGISIKAIGVLLVSAFIVIPPCAARLLSGNFTLYVILSATIGAVSAIVGITLSTLFNLPSGPSIVVTQLAIFLLTLIVPQSQGVDP